MSSFLEKNSIMSPRQYDFVSGHGTIALLEEFADDLFNSVDINLFACALFIDVSKAFDSVCHNLLLRKLCLLGCRGPFFALLYKYLSERSQVVATDDHFHFSRPLSLFAGVPQGSILSPLLVNIDMNDFYMSIFKCIVYQYADDTVLVAKHVNYEKA